ncbi:MAG TPA: hypothetical protein DEP03_08495 [Massilia sp.]|nr:hypothetical protein [Massilia sp.]
MKVLPRTADTGSGVPARRSDHPPPLLSACVALALGAAAVLTGMIAATAHPLLIALGAGAILSALLLLFPKLNMWLAIVLGLGSGTLLSLAGGVAGKMQWGIVLLSMILFVPVLLHALPRPRLPLFMWLYLVYVLLSLATTLLNWNGPAALVAGAKRYYQSLGIMLALALVPLTWKDTRRLRVSLLGIGLLQLPFVLYEAIVLVPIRASMRSDQGSEVTDVIAGTFGANIRGGSPGAEMVAFVLILIAFAWARWRVGLLSTGKLMAFIALMLPCVTLGEVKFVVFLFPLVALVLYKEDIVARPGRFVPAMVLAGLVTAAFVYLYFGYFSRGAVGDGFDSMLRYNVAEQGYGQFLLNRSSALDFWWERQGSHDPAGFLLGHGLSSSYWTTDPNVPSGAIGARFPWYGIGLTAASALLWDVGVLGALLYLSVFLVAFRQAGRLYARTQDAETRCTLLGIQAALAVFVAFIPYKDSMLTIFPFQIVIALVLGFLAQILRNPDVLRAPRQP